VYKKGGKNGNMLGTSKEGNTIRESPPIWQKKTRSKESKEKGFHFSVAKTRKAKRTRGKSLRKAAPHMLAEGGAGMHDLRLRATIATSRDAPNKHPKKGGWESGAT